MEDGGFMSQPAGSSQMDDGKKKRTGGKQALIPATIKMCLETQGGDGDDNCEVDGRFSTQVRIVANILGVEPRETRIHYFFEDGTGKIEGTTWIGQNDDEMPVLKERRDKCVPGQHVVVVGAVKDFNGTKTLRCYDVRPIEDYNEMTHHFLEVCYLHTKAKKEQAKPAVVNFGSTMNSNQGAGAMEVEAPANCLSMHQNRVLEYYNTTGTGDEGCQMAQVADAMANFMTHQECIDAINVLVAEGFLYSTIDEDYHKSTDSC